ncbi:MAG: phage antirepressor KilAC domain-containing protein [Clostridiaceae bacterium]|nr:phage antirepressor KilAC domain-containing protein [Clostridiaceae bacterium]
MNELQIFNSPEFGQIRTIVENGKVLFCGSDVAKALGYSNTRDALIRHCKGVVKRDTPTKSGIQQMSFISEGDIYRLAAKSELPGADKFESWIFDDVLPSIRKTGGYIPTEGMSDSEIMARALFIAQRSIEEKNMQISQQTQKIEADAPKVLFADSVTASHTSILIFDLAKLLRQNGVQIGGNRLFDWMRGNGYLIKRKGSDYNMPTQKSMELGLFEVKETSITHSDGHVSVNKTPKVTGKGQIYFINKFLH